MISSLFLRYVLHFILQLAVYHKCLFCQFYSVTLFIIILFFLEHTEHHMNPNSETFPKEYGILYFDHWVGVNVQGRSSYAVQGAEDTLVAVLRLFCWICHCFFPGLSHSSPPLHSVNLISLFL